MELLAGTEQKSVVNVVSEGDSMLRACQENRSGELGRANLRIPLIMIAGTFIVCSIPPSLELFRSISSFELDHTLELSRTNQFVGQLRYALIVLAGCTSTLLLSTFGGLLVGCTFGERAKKVSEFLLSPFTFVQFVLGITKDSVKNLSGKD
ncbi:hypothetical protein ACFLY9_02390 [Patescibacteria group bacterium]